MRWSPVSVIVAAAAVLVTLEALLVVVSRYALLIIFLGGLGLGARWLWWRTRDPW